MSETPSRLEQLGYSQQLERRLNIPEVVGLAMADVSPTMAVLFLSAGVFFVGGTFSIGAGLILSAVASPTTSGMFNLRSSCWE